MAALPNAVKNAPVTTLTTAEALVGAVLTFLVTHRVIGDIDVSATTQTIAPFVALALPALFGAVKWRLVSPYEKVKEVAERDGLATDADFARIGAIFEDKMREWGLEVDDTEPADDETDTAMTGDDTGTAAAADTIAVAEVVDEPYGAGRYPEHLAPQHEGVELAAPPAGMSAGIR